MIEKTNETNCSRNRARHHAVRHRDLQCNRLGYMRLRRAGILKSQRGVKGGYTFLRAPREVTVLDIVECVDGPLRPSGNGNGGGASAELWDDAQTRLADMLNAVSIAVEVNF